jgi:hypothetical protein
VKIKHTKVPHLPGHAIRVRVIGALSGLLMITGLFGARVCGREVGPCGLTALALGFVGMGVAQIMVRYARCPLCGAIMRQRGWPKPGQFHCARCHKKWQTAEHVQEG